MSLVIPPGFALASIEHWLGGYNRPAVTTWGLDVSAFSGSPDELAEEFSIAYRGSLGPRYDTNVTMRDARVVIGQDGGDPVIGFSYTSGAGTRNNESTPPALALMVDKRTLLGGRRNRGRAYLPWALADTEVSEVGAVTGSVVNAWQTLFANYILALEAADIPPVVLHGPGLTTPPPPTPITNFVVNGTVRTQRRRQVRY